ncbi:MAG: DUF917 domain-containing protein [Clostridioides sp.]|jgi:DUF917 family protein|nr:DUF917 domain-containing protein [Clostridioides sp.]
MRVLNEKQIIDVLNGATILGGGGGGSISAGIDMLNTYKAKYGSPELTLITPNEMEEGKYCAITAGMGSPLSIKGIDFSKFAINAYNYLKEVASEMEEPKEISYCAGVELGGFNTFIPMLLSMMENKPFIDADGAGRAVPALETLLLHVNGCNTSPCVMANDKNDRVLIQTTDPKNAKLCEDIGRGVCVAMGMKAGLSGWILDKSEVENKIATMTITKTEEIGKMLQEIGPTDTSLFDKLDNARTLCVGTITDIKAEVKGGFDYGETTIVDDKTGEEYLIKFVNENLVTYKKENGEFSPIVTVPEITTIYEQVSAKPLTNADTFVGQKVVVGIIKASDEWWFTSEENVYSYWKTYLDVCEYKGKLIHF